MQFSTTLDERFDLDFKVGKTSEKYKVRPLGGGELLDAMEIQKQISKNVNDLDKVMDGVQKLWNLVLDHIEEVEGETYTQPLKEVFPKMSISEQNRFITFIISESEKGETEETPDTDKLEEAYKKLEAEQKAKSNS